MKILVIENNVEEQQKAKDAVEAAGHEAIVTADSHEAVGLIADVDAVITDMFFVPEGCSDTNKRYYAQNEPAMGLTMVIMSMSQNKPVVVCTDTEHHDKELSFVYDGFVSAMYHSAKEKDCTINYFEWLETQAPFGWIEYKAWGEAVSTVEARMASKK